MRKGFRDPNKRAQVDARKHNHQNHKQRSPSLSMLSSTSSSSSVASSLSLSQNDTKGPTITSINNPSDTIDIMSVNNMTTTSTKTTSLTTRDQLLDNEMRPFKNRGFHDGYDVGKRIVLQDAFDSGYKKAFEQNFILSTLKGVASALKSNYNINISSNHLSLLNSMKFDGSSDSESIKKDLIAICRENRLEVLAHYVSQVG